MRKIRKGDDVVVMTGKDNGKRGNVLKVLPEADKLIVENVNIVKKHTKPNPQAGVSGGIIEKEMPIHVSNVMLYNPQTKKGDRVGFRTLEDGRKVRVFKSNDEVVDV
ncbi:LSU ribosomal protein L24P [Thiogranum longum]|uniref:Large ribosomal subunit protein uL24 n=1 Tax=Thiogranum longum TaxID=1537524 RepID=A0A4R1HJ83_9GAMM|nr:50S ribosomal protein L24 [Thiogranum longum]TCK17282.1 LSU ribosomal protein L24P [Thiogranum longum]